ncbi:DUF3010 family protein [Pseudomonas brassicacearum]|uniref:DUF3010 family protein n=1 Tax=Pseudomonas brassicacearum TaxID=930166 RepID=UPI0009B9282D|nr:DUF3010 family protein [Pseudomonas brassicacearum]
MRICGVELSGSDAVFAIVDEDIWQECNTKKITFGDSLEKQSAKFFYEAVNSFARDHHIDIFAIKHRQDSGRFAGGGITFKMEALFQLCPDADAVIIYSATIASEQKKNGWIRPDGMNKYQEGAYFTARCASK